MVSPPEVEAREVGDGHQGGDADARQLGERWAAVGQVQAGVHPSDEAAHEVAQNRGLEQLGRVQSQVKGLVSANGGEWHNLQQSMTSEYTCRVPAASNESGSGEMEKRVVSKDGRGPDLENCKGVPGRSAWQPCAQSLAPLTRTACTPHLCACSPA